MWEHLSSGWFNIRIRSRHCMWLFQHGGGFTEIRNPFALVLVVLRLLLQGKEDFKGVKRKQTKDTNVKLRYV